MSDFSSTIGFFTAEHVAKITGLSERQLVYWDDTLFFHPHYSSFGEGRSAIRVYSFRDVVSLRTLQVLKTKHKISLQRLRTVAEKLLKYSPAPFAELKLVVCKGEVSFREPETGGVRGVISGQYVLLPIIDVINEVKRSAADLATRTPAEYGKIERHAGVARRAPVIAGTRIPVRTVARFLEAGYSPEAILEQYPSLTLEDIAAVERNRKAQLAA
jgi:uncharacterized protein (DUF433 family)